MMRTAFTALFLIAAASPAAAQSAGSALTVDEAVAIALAHNRRIANADLEVEKATQDVLAARTRRLPQFSIDTQLSQLLKPIDILFPQGAFGAYPSIGPVPATDTTLRTPARPTVIFNAQATQPLLQLYRIGLDVKFSEAARALERESARSARLTLVYEVKRIYFSILQTESAIDAASYSLTLLREVQRVVGDRVVQRTALESDAMAVDVRLARAGIQRNALVNTAASLKEQLNQLLGRDIQTAFVTAGVPGGDPGISDVDTAHTRALESRSDVRQARVRLQQAEIARQIARADFMPDVSLSLSYAAPMNIDGAPRHIATAGVQLQWEPFDWGRRSRAAAARGLAVQQAANAVREQEDQVRLDVNARARKLAEARGELQVAALAQGAARETSRVRATQYRVQAALLSDVLQAASAQADADHHYVQALAALWVARAEFERALGED